jgi:hypothetical protein
LISFNQSCGIFGCLNITGGQMLDAGWGLEQVIASAATDSVICPHDIDQD